MSSDSLEKLTTSEREPKLEHVILTSEQVQDIYESYNRDLKTALVCRSHETLRAQLAADDKRLCDAGLRVGMYFGCDTPDHMADEIESLRGQIEAMQAYFGSFSPTAPVDQNSGEVIPK